MFGSNINDLPDGRTPTDGSRPPVSEDAGAPMAGMQVRARAPGDCPTSDSSGASFVTIDQLSN